MVSGVSYGQVMVSPLLSGSDSVQIELCFYIIFMQALNCCRNGEWNWNVDNAAIRTSESSSDIEY